MHNDTEIENTEVLKSLEDTPTVGYGISISPFLLKLLEKQVHLTKTLRNPATTKNTWILDAIKHKLERDENCLEIPRERHIGITIDENLSKRILKKVDFIRKFRTSYSKKLWVIDAIMEKLENDRDELKKMLDEISR